MQFQTVFETFVLDFRCKMKRIRTLISYFSCVAATNEVQVYSLYYAVILAAEFSSSNFGPSLSQKLGPPLRTDTRLYHKVRSLMAASLTCAGERSLASKTTTELRAFQMFH